MVDNFCSIGYILRICMWRLHQIKPSWRLRSGQNPGAPLTYFNDGGVRRIFLRLTFWPKGIFLCHSPNPTPVWPRWSPNALHHKGVCYLVISQESSKSNVSAFYFPLFTWGFAFLTQQQSMEYSVGAILSTYKYRNEKKSNFLRRFLGSQCFSSRGRT